MKKRRSRHQFVIASQFIGEAIQRLKLLFFLDCFVALLLAITTENQIEPLPTEGEVDREA